MFRGCVAWRVQGFRGFGFVARLQFFFYHGFPGSCRAFVVLN